MQDTVLLLARLGPALPEAHTAIPFGQMGTSEQKLGSSNQLLVHTSRCSRLLRHQGDLGSLRTSRDPSLSATLWPVSASSSAFAAFARSWFRPLGRSALSRDAVPVAGPHPCRSRRWHPRRGHHFTRGAGERARAAVGSLAGALPGRPSLAHRADDLHDEA
jgi:hypothetical protein